MIYSNPEFFALFFVTLTLYLILRKPNYRFNLILFSSFLFYAWTGVVDTLIFAVVILVSWFAVFLAKTFPRKSSLWIVSGITLMALHLFFWKYATWAVGEIQSVAPGFLHGRKMQLPLPVGISFFTLQGIAYLVDYRRGNAGFLTLKEYTFFKSFFPQLVAGPIVRASQLVPQLRKLKTPVLAEMGEGLGLFVLGFFKKVALADRVALFVDPVFQSPSQYHRGVLVLGLVAYSVQIWADFSGYTDMGRGVAKLLGIHLPENFKSPYLSLSPSEFWKRWHITLSEWIRDYIYLPLSHGLGGRGRGAIFAALVITMALSGLWHGANWTFVVWGLYHGVLLVGERQLKGSVLCQTLFRRLPSAVRAGLLLVVMFGLTLGGWLVFRSSSLAAAGWFLGALWSGTGTVSFPISPRGAYFAISICASLHIVFYRPRRDETFVTFGERGALWFRKTFSPRLEGVMAGAVLAFTFLLALFLGTSAGRGFIYFQF